MQKVSFAREMDRTQTDVSKITCWCLTIALHQNFGVGRTRIDRISDYMTRLEEENEAVMKMQDTRHADEIRESWLDGICDKTFRVPLLRAPRGRREEQLRIAGDRAATIAWQLYAKACIEVLGFKAQRLERLKKLAWDNYAQFNVWAHNDGVEVAFEMLKRCAEDALKEGLEVVDNEKQSDEQSRQVQRELDRAAEQRAMLNQTTLLARASRPEQTQAAPLAIDSKALAESIKRQIDTARQSSVIYRY